MLNFKNLFKSVYGDIMVARKLVMKRASQLHKMGVTLSSSLKRAWSEAKSLVEEVVTRIKTYILQVDKQRFTIKSNDLDEVVDQCLERIEEVKSKRFAYNVINNLNARWNVAMEMFELRGSLTFAQDVYVRAVRS